MLRGNGLRLGGGVKLEAAGRRASIRRQRELRVELPPGRMQADKPRVAGLLDVAGS